MWFGDLVTMRWWDDLWLNESFAEYVAHRCCRRGHLRTRCGPSSASSARTGARSPTRRPSTHPVAGNGAADADAALQDFDGISYAKGAAVLKQLVGLPRRRRVPRRSARLLRRPTRTATRRWPTCSRPGNEPARRTLTAGPGTGCRPLGRTRCRSGRRDRRGRPDRRTSCGGRPPPGRASGGRTPLPSRSSTERDGSWAGSR